MASRLAASERRMAVKTAILYIVLTVFLLFALSKFGPFVITLFTGSIQRTDQNTQTTQFVPTPKIDQLPEITNSKVITVSGNTSEAGTVRLLLNGESRDVLANAQGRFSTDWELVDNQNTLTARSVLQNGQTSSEVTLNIVFDNLPPKIENLSPENNTTRNGKKEENINITGDTESENTIRINDRISIVSSNGRFESNFQLSEGENEFTIVASDPAGNQTTEVLNITFNP